MGLFGKPKEYKITSKFSYLPLRDPRTEKLKTVDLIPLFPGAEPGADEYLQKYLFMVRNHISRNIVESWFVNCHKRKDSFVNSLGKNVDEDEFVGYMVQGFAMAVCEYETFQITKAEQMPSCVFGAMKNMAMQALMNNDAKSQKLQLTALLSGYFVARENLKANASI